MLNHQSVVNVSNFILASHTYVYSATVFIQCGNKTQNYIFCSHKNLSKNVCIVVTSLCSIYKTVKIKRNVCIYTLYKTPRCTRVCTYSVDGDNRI